MKNPESKNNTKRLPEPKLKRRDFLKGIAAVSIATATGCNQVCEKPVSKENGGLLSSLYPQIYQILKQNSPELIEMTDRYLRDYLDGETMDRTRFGKAANLASEDKPPMNCITVMTKDEVSIMKSRTIAYQIYLDLQEKLPWAIKDLNDSEMQMLCDTSSHFESVNGNNEIECRFYPLAPSYPEEIFDFLVKNNLIKSTHQKTIEKMIEWFRDHAIHYRHIDETDQELIKRYNHLGAPTIMDLTAQTEKQILIHIQGCSGSVEFFKQILQIAGIPIKKIFPKLNGAAHVSVEFPTVNKAVFHGDDLHSFWSQTPEGEKIPPSLLLIPPEEVNDCRENFEECRDSGYDNAMHQLSIAEKYMTEKDLLYQAYYLTGTYPHAIYSPGYMGGIQLPQERLDALHKKYQQKLLDIGNGNLVNAINILSKINERYEND